MTLRLVQDDNEKWAIWNHMDKKITKDHDSKKEAVKELLDAKKIRIGYAKHLEQTGMVEFG